MFHPECAKDATGHRLQCVWSAAVVAVDPATNLWHHCRNCGPDSEDEWGASCFAIRYDAIR